MSIIIVKCSKDKKNWVKFYEFVLPPDAIFIPDEEYFIREYSLVRQGYKYWKIEKEGEKKE
jgi:hypothetical protein